MKYGKLWKIPGMLAVFILHVLMFGFVFYYIFFHITRIWAILLILLCSVYNKVFREKEKYLFLVFLFFFFFLIKCITMFEIFLV